MLAGCGRGLHRRLLTGTSQAAAPDPGGGASPRRRAASTQDAAERGGEAPGAAPVRAVTASVACLSASILPGFLTGAFGNDIKAEFGIGDTGLGLALAATYGLSAVATVHAGEFSDRVGWRRSLLISMWVTLAGYAAVIALARSFAGFLVALAVAGAGLTLAGPAAKVLVARHVAPRRHGLAFGVHMSGIPLATLLAGLMVPLLGGSAPLGDLGWRLAFAGGAALTVAGMLMLPAGEDPAGVPPALAAPQAGRFGHVRLGPLFVFGAAATLASSAVIGAATFFVVSSEGAGISEGAAGLLLSVASAGVIAVRITLGVLADRDRSGAVGTVAVLLAASASGYMLMAADAPGLYALGGQVSIILGWSWPALMVVAVVRMSPHAPGLASAFVVSGLNLGAVAGPAAFGVISDTVSPPAALWVAGSAALAAACLSLLGRLLTRSPWA